jgi:hypothetical protein
MRDRGDQILPQARRDNLVVETLPDEVLVYDTERHKAHCLNRTAALVWDHCDGRTSVADVARHVERELQTPVDHQVVWLAVEQLEKARLLTETSSHRPGLSRRDLLKRLGVAAAVALPLVTTIVSPTAAAVASCAGLGDPCAETVTPLDCCSPFICISNICSEV